MAPGEKRQLENVINEVLKNGDFQQLHLFLQRGVPEDTPMKCSQQFVNKLDQLVNKSLDRNDPKAVSLIFASLYKCGKNLKVCGTGQGLPGLITRGLVEKMVQWFEKCKQLWIQYDQHQDVAFTVLEDFLNVLMMIHEACKEGTYKVTESFLHLLAQLAVDPRVYILIQKEAIRDFNLLLDKMPVELKKERKLLTSQEFSDLMMKLAGRILDGGDYDFQSSLIESLFRMTTPVQRRELADRWFSMGHIASAFTKICDSEFETGCRQFLNMVNGMHGDKRRVYSYPCLEVFLDTHELLMPVDEKLEEFWIDFNLGSRSISFYFTLADAEESYWEAMSINANEVVSYTVTEKCKRKVLQINMSEVVVVGPVEGSSLSIHFSSSLDILQAAANIYGLGKNRAMSVVKSTMEENNTQVIPESQVSLSGSEKNTAPYLLPPRSAPLQMSTPAKLRILESTHAIACSGGGMVHNGGPFALKNKLSISEMIMLPTQKINSLPKPESRSRLGGKQEHPLTLKQKLSVPETFPVWQRKFRVEVTQRLQGLLHMENKDPPPQEPAAPQEKASNIKINSKNSSSGDQRMSSHSTPEEPQVQRKERTSGKTKRQASADVEASVVKSSRTKTQQEKAASKKNNDPATSSKMQRDSDVASSMLKLVMNHYEKKTKSTKESSATTPQPLNPPLTNSGVHKSPLRLNTAKKGQRAEKNKRHVKKHLFSDTDTDNATTEVSWLRESGRKPKPNVTKYSREASNKTAAKPLRTSCQSSDLFPTSAKAVLGNSKPSKAEPKKTVKRPAAAAAAAAAAGTSPRAAVKRPKRAAATSTKNYREPDSDDSKSDTDLPPLPSKVRPQNVFKKKVAAPQDQENTVKAPRVPCRITRYPSSPLMEKMRYAYFQSKYFKCYIKSPLTLQPLKCKLICRKACVCVDLLLSAQLLSQLFEHLCLLWTFTAAERSAPTLGSVCSPLLSPQGSPLPASPDPPSQDSPPLVLLPPQRRSPVSSKGKGSLSSLYGAGKGSSKTNSVQSVRSLTSPRGQTRGAHSTAREKSKAKKYFSSASPSPVCLPSQPLLTSTVNEQDKSPAPSPPQSPLPEETLSYGRYYGMTKNSTPSGPSLSPSSTKSSVLTDGDKDGPTAAAEKTPLRKRGSKIAKRHGSGPCHKRHFSSSDSEDDEKQVKNKGKMRDQRPPRMKPRKLFKSFTEASALEKLRKAGASAHRSHWEDEGLDEDLDVDEDPDAAVNPANLYQQFSSEIKTKFQNRYRMIEAYHKQSLKTVQQHVSSIKKQVIKHRTQRLELVQKVLSEEISKLELDDSVLKSMEKDSTVYWRKQTTTLRLYKKQEVTRNETLKRALQSTTCQSLEHEEGIFTSQMGLMRNDMKSAQDRLLSKMQENELESMKRGLHSLFFP
ncbi:synaptonemal complex protein 2 [Salarias fasciatus]|uniref:synaptonemal complex protein 2 n=1 Tax=Salarias fasciatus TaxID=181472 RepID=UPI001176757A|nr:synaptonemal complex protein 2 [Salarias fasciatus]